MSEEERNRELAAKRQQLLELKLERQRRTANRTTLPVNETAPAQNGNIRPSMSAKDMEEVLQSVGLQNTPSLGTSRSASNFTQSNGVNNNLVVNDMAASKPPRPSQLEIVPLATFSVPPKNDNRYNKTTQTTDTETHMDGFSTGSRDEFEFDEMSLGDKTGHLDDMSLDDTSPTNTIAKILGRVNMPSNFHHQATNDEPAPVKPSKPPELTSEQKEKIIGSESFQRFIGKTSRWVERVIAVEREKDIFADYTSDRADGQHTDALLSLRGRFNTGDYVGQQIGRAVDFSDMHPELMAVVVNGKQTSSSGPKGVINIWNSNFSTASPENAFHSNSAIKSLCFAKFHPKLIVGGCETGQLCIWDMRSNKRNPVNKSPISSRAHTQEIMQMQVIGTPNTHAVVTTSLDGIICWWSLDNLHTPVEKMTVSFGPKNTLPISSFSFYQNDVAKFVLGGEDGFLYQGERHEATGQMSCEIPAHAGAITNVELHKTVGSIDFSHFCLTSSTDFTCKLWNLADAKKPVMSFENKHGSYVTDVRWSPVHPATFVSCSLSGQVNLWNLNVDADDPVAAVRAGKSIYRCRWSPDGRQLAALDESGAVQLYEVHEMMYNVKSTEYDTFSGVCREAVMDAQPVELDQKSNGQISASSSTATLSSALVS